MAGETVTTGSRKACKIRFPIFSLSLVLGSFYNIYFWRSGPKTEVRNSKGGAGVRELRVRLPPAARLARSYQHKGAAAGGRAGGPRGGASQRRRGPSRAGPPGLGAQSGRASGGAAEAATEAGGRGGGAREWGGRRQPPP